MCIANRINRLKVVLAEKGKTGKWLAKELGRDKATVSKWCTSRCQPDVNTFLQIAILLFEHFSQQFLAWTTYSGETLAGFQPLLLLQFFRKPVPPQPFRLMNMSINYQ